MKFTMPLLKKEDMVPILPITTSDASKVEDEPDAVAADGKLDASNKKLSTTSDTIKFKLKELGRILIEPYDKEKVFLFSDMQTWIISMQLLYCNTVYSCLRIFPVNLSFSGFAEA